MPNEKKNINIGFIINYRLDGWLGVTNYYLNLLLNELHWEQKQINLYGKSINLPRLTAYFSNQGINYSYSGINHQSAEYPAFINSIFCGLKEEVMSISSFPS